TGTPVDTNCGLTEVTVWALKVLDPFADPELAVSVKDDPEPELRTMVRCDVNMTAELVFHVTSSVTSSTVPSEKAPMAVIVVGSSSSTTCGAQTLMDERVVPVT